MKRISALFILLPLVFIGCIKITTVEQPTEAKAGAEITVKVHLETDLGEGTEAEDLAIQNAHGLLGVCIPNDWELIFAEFSGDVSGRMSEDRALADDCEGSYPPDLGYHWIALISQQGFVYTEKIVKFLVTLEFKVGEVTGDYHLIYRSGLSYGAGSDTTTVWHEHTEVADITVR